MMKTSLTYAFGMSLAGILIHLLSYLLGHHNDPSSFQTGQTIALVTGPLIAVSVLVLGLRTLRDESPTQSLSYGRAVGAGTLISSLSGTISAMFTYVYGTFINPEFHQVMYEFQISKVAEQMTASQIEQAAPMMRFFTSAAWISLAQFLFSPILGVILSAIIAFFVKRTPREPDPSGSGA